MKKMLLSALLATTLVGCSDNDVADVGLGWFTLKDIKVGE
ncbi:catabolite regulation protein CreA, partial [Vibrio sp. V42_P2S4T144]|nr:catabolite regulation protein CreA [Vibrio sp. V42_P2S4T144]